MLSHTNRRFWKSYRALPNEIRLIAKKQYKIFRENPYHASLHFKRVHANQPIYSARITKDYRVLGVVKESVVIWFWIGSHSDYDKLLK
ncbi:MAG: hypothetical protein U9N49_02215 [Campylobacterota bacterium]|nr:hypothetical protein [Campylobacterota bacterium]